MGQPIDARQFLSTLIDRDIETFSGRRNRVLRLSGDEVLVATERSPSGAPVPIEWVQAALDRLTAGEDVEISVESVGYRSAFIGAVLLQVPGIVKGVNPQRVRIDTSDAR